MPEFYMIIARKYFSDFFWGGVGARAPCLQSPTPMVIVILFKLVVISSMAGIRETE